MGIKRLLSAVSLACLLGLSTTGCGIVGSSADPTNGPYVTTIEPGLRPRLTGADAVTLTRDYLARQTPELAVSEMHTPANITEVWAVRASDARKLDRCIPREASDGIVWVTKGSGDFLNLRVHLWSSNFSQQVAADPVARACLAPWTSGTLVLDDATGDILGVSPGVHASDGPTDASPSAQV